MVMLPGDRKPTVKLYSGDCLKILPKLPSASVDAVITDPPYPCIKREYGYWTEEQWMGMMRAVVPECMRVLRPTGSAMFVLQPNSERVGKMRTWLWDFMSWVGREYGIVQDVWWWNTKAIPEHHAIQGRLMRPSVKACVWVGQSDCWRNQDAVLWDECSDMKARRASVRSMGKSRRVSPSGHRASSSVYTAAVLRGGVTPYNMLPIATDHSQSGAGGYGHGAGTPLALCSWWTRYICPLGGAVLDPFIGSGTVALACLQEGRSCIGIEKMTGYYLMARDRVMAYQEKKACK